MLFDSTYISIESEVFASYQSGGSQFLAHAYGVKNEIEIKNHLSQLKLKYPDATHHCYAWILHPDKSAQRLNDDGEPSNTAARPILKQINALNLTNILVVVVRYFGGKKLGIPGLIEAYGNAAFLCLKGAKLIKNELIDYYLIESEIIDEHVIYNLAKQLGAQIIENSRLKNLSITLSIPSNKSEALIAAFKKMANFEVKYLKTE